MRSSSPFGALTDIKDNIGLARSFVTGFSFSSFQADRRTVYAVTRCLEIISEASRRLPIELKKRNPQVPWAEIAGAGSVYRHAYELVRDDVVWQTVEHSFDPLLTAVERELSRLGKQGGET
jgi:uncharacterized protein with HEPN domain